MLNKLISTVVLGCSFAVMPASGKDPDGLLFLFISPNKWVGTIRLALALALFFISFKTFSKSFARNKKLQKGLLVSGLAFIAFGLVSSLEASLGTIFYDYLKPLDLMIILEAGIIMSTMALTSLPTAKTRPVVTKTRKAVPKLLQETA